MRAIRPDFLGEVARRAGMAPRPAHRQFVVQHLYDDTLRLLLTSHRYVPLDVVIGIGYSGKPHVAEALRSAGIRVLTPSYPELAETIRVELASSLSRAGADGARLILHEVGGAALTALHRYFRADIGLVRAAVEITKQGVWAARRIPDLAVPQLNCAETRLKELEGPLVGDAVVHALDHILRDVGYALWGRTALVLGHGWVGRGVCDSLRAEHMSVIAHDTDVILRVASKLAGYPLLDEVGSLDRISLVVGAAGTRTIDEALIGRLPDGCFLASASSKDVEIDVAHLRRRARKVERIHRHIEAFDLDGRTLFLVNEGYPVNFTGASVPDEVVEMLFAEALLLLDQACTRELAPGTYPLAPELEELPAQVWLDLR